MASKTTIWLTRPREDSSSFASELVAHGMTSIIAPVLQIKREPMPAISITHPAALLITSRHATHALAALPAEWRALPAYCVGSATAQAATEYGLTRIIPGARNAMALLPHILSDIAAGSELLYLAGDETRTDVVSQLNANSIHVTTAIVYRAIAERTLNDEIRSALDQRRIDATAFFSARSAEIACKLLKQNGLTSAPAHMNAYCLSPAVATAAKAMQWGNVYTCSTPTRYAMRELIVSRERKKG